MIFLCFFVWILVQFKYYLKNIEWEIVYWYNIKVVKCVLNNSQMWILGDLKNEFGDRRLRQLFTMSMSTIMFNWNK